MSDAKLPPLPPSDGDSLYHNGAYRNFWQDAEIIRVDDTPMKKCNHEFEPTPTGVKCKKCHFGLLARDLEIKDGKLYLKGESIGL